MAGVPLTWHDALFAHLFHCCAFESVSCFVMLQLLLARYSRTEDVITLTTVANNLKRPDLAGVLGPFSNTVAIRTDLSGEDV